VGAIVVSPSSSTIPLNAQLPLQAKVQDESGAIVPDATVTWTVQDPKIVSISDGGVVTALAVGTSAVAANALGKSGVATITVNSVPPASPPASTPPASTPPASTPPAATPAVTVATVTVTAPSKKLKAGSMEQLTATALDRAGSAVPHQSFVWSSSNVNIAPVSETGVVTGKRSGDVTITARTSGGDGKSGSVQIEVK